MKIGNIKAGEEYAVLDSPARNGNKEIPRHVVVREIVAVEEKRYGRYTRLHEMKTIRRVSVTFLDGGAKTSSYRWDRIAGAAQGQALVIEARQVIAPWAEIKEEILAKADIEQRRIALENELQARVDALGLDPHSRMLVRVRIEGEELTSSFTLHDHDLNKILALAEAGKENA